MPEEGILILDRALYGPWLSGALGVERKAEAKALSAKRGRTGIGIATLATGILGAAPTGLCYYLGTEAGTTYNAAADTASAQAARQSVELFSTLFCVSAGVGGAGLIIGPMLMSGGPNAAALRKSVQSLDTQIKELKNE